MKRPKTLAQKIETLDRKIERLALKIYEEEIDFAPESDNNKLYRKLVDERCELFKIRDEFIRTFNADFIDES
ncbi:hypothetical protein U2I53_03030 [Lysinibacillus capsici]